MRRANRNAEVFDMNQERADGRDNNIDNQSYHSHCFTPVVFSGLEISSAALLIRYTLWGS